MKYIKIKIVPTSAFCVMPSSDTFFGHICYTLALQNKDVDSMLKDYGSSPFLVVSDFFPMGYGLYLKGIDEVNNKDDNTKKAKVTLTDIAKRKALKKCNQVNIDSMLASGNIEEPKAPCWQIISTEVPHVMLNRLTASVDNKSNGKFSTIDYYFKSNIENEEMFFDIYILVDDKYEKDVIDAIKLIGQLGYGKKTSIGKGRFIVENIEEISIKIDEKHNSLYLLSSCVLYGIYKYTKNIYYTPVVKFGKHSSIFSNGSVFKKPYIMASQGALLTNVDKSIFQKGYIGSSIENYTVDKKCVSQGYSLYIPVTI